MGVFNAMLRLRGQEEEQIEDTIITVQQCIYIYIYVYIYIYIYSKHLILNI